MALSDQSLADVGGELRGRGLAGLARRKKQMLSKSKGVELTA